MLGPICQQGSLVELGGSMEYVVPDDYPFLLEVSTQLISSNHSFKVNRDNIILFYFILYTWCYSLVDGHSATIIVLTSAFFIFPL